MRILVISDVHGRDTVAEKIISSQPEAGHVFFLGDGLRGMEDMPYLFPDKTFYMVSGNCDGDSFTKSTDIVTLGGIKILFTHGHPFNVKWTLERLKSHAKASGAKLTLYGHTHTPKCEYEDGFYFLNPGAVSNSSPSYAVVDIVESGIAPNIIYI